jgi:hypothetical protein
MEEDIYRIIYINSACSRGSAGCPRKEIEEYGIEKIGTYFIVARGNEIDCKKILEMIDPKIEKK